MIRVLAMSLSMLPILLVMSVISTSATELIDRVVAVVNDELILLSELESEVTVQKTSGSDVTAEDVLENMINRMLLLTEARKFIRDNTVMDEETLLNAYVERWIKSMIYISYEEMEAFYRKNREIYGDRDFYIVKDEIESLMIERELKRRMLRHIRELRENSYIRIQLDDTG